LHEILVSIAHIQAEKFSRLNDLVCHPMEYAYIRIEYADLEYILREILTNAFKFSNIGDQVNVSSVTNGDLVYVTISNQGLSMTQEEIDKIGAFMQFKREIHEQQGLGLGLTIARKMIQLHEGHSRIYNSDKGVSVEISFPIDREVVND
jgi:signal transduction histidine kinase